MITEKKTEKMLQVSRENPFK